MRMVVEVEVKAEVKVEVEVPAAIQLKSGLNRQAKRAVCNTHC